MYRCFRLSWPRVSQTGKLRILELVDQLIANKAKLNEWAEKTQRQVRSVAELFVKMLSEDHVSRLAQDQIPKYKTLLLTLPKQYGKGENDKNLPLSDWLKRAKKLPAKEVGRVGATLNRHMGQLDDVLSYIRANGYTIRDYSGVTELRANSAGRPREARNFLDPEDYTAFFRLPPWTGCESPGKSHRRRIDRYPRCVVRSDFGAEDAARREEICGLDVDDVLEEDGIPYIFIRNNEHRRIENPQSTQAHPLVARPAQLAFLSILQRSRRWATSCCFRICARTVIEPRLGMSFMTASWSTGRQRFQAIGSKRRYFIPFARLAATI